VNSLNSVTREHSRKVANIATRGKAPEREDADEARKPRAVDVHKVAAPWPRAVIGAGTIGVEYATIFSALGVAATSIAPRATFPHFIDEELIDEFML
jgi:pyruvate/2-oxoglutarate dehydrogenase complex dihydrolipoamide dehydrogenase (E3) component